MPYVWLNSQLLTTRLTRSVVPSMVWNSLRLAVSVGFAERTTVQQARQNHKQRAVRLDRCRNIARLESVRLGRGPSVPRLAFPLFLLFSRGTFWCPRSSSSAK